MNGSFFNHSTDHMGFAKTQMKNNSKRQDFSAGSASILL